MRIVFAIAILSSFILISCQKELGDPQVPQVPVIEDSAWYISNFQRIGLDVNDPQNNMVDTATDYYTYETGKIIHRSYLRSDNVLDSIKFSYYYNSDNDLLKITKDYGTGYLDDLYNYSQMDFNYSSGRLSQIVTHSNSTSRIQEFDYSTDGRIITIYDTMPNTNWEETILLYKYFFAADMKLDSFHIVERSIAFNVPVVYDTIRNIIKYDNGGNIKTFISQGNFATNYNGTFERFFEYDSIAYSMRETRGAELYNTVKKILGKIAYHEYLHYYTNDALLFDGSPTYQLSRMANFPVGFAYSYSENNFGTHDVSGTFTNTFDNNNRLVGQVLPESFGPKSIGVSVFTYNYIKTAK